MWALSFECFEVIVIVVVGRGIYGTQTSDFFASAGTITESVCRTECGGDYETNFHFLSASALEHRQSQRFNLCDFSDWRREMWLTIE